MSKKLRWRILVVMSVIALCCYEVASEPLNLGIDLRGGTHLTLEVSTDGLSEGQKTDVKEQTLRILRNRIDEIGLAGTSVQHGNRDRILIQIPGIGTEDSERIKNIIKRQAHLEFRLVVDEPVSL